MYEKFSALLEKTGKTAYRVSKDTGIAENIFSYWKAGRSRPKFEKLLILARYFEVPVEYFSDEEKTIEEGVQNAKDETT